MPKISQGLELGNVKATRESTGTAASGGSPIVLHDGKTVRKSRTAEAGRKPPPASEDSDPTPRRSGKMSPLPNVLVAIESAADRGGGDRPVDDRKMPAAAAAANQPLPQGDGEMTLEPESSHEPSSPQVESIKRGSIVFVQSRTWPGINKPGGVGRVTRIHPADDSNVIKYDIKVRSICLSRVVGSLGVSLSFAVPVVHSRRLGEER